MQLHTNLWYAEYTHEQAIRQFSSSFSDLLSVFEKHKAAACWDWETSISLQMLSEANPTFLDRLNALVDAGLHDVIPCTWGNILATHNTLAEFHNNFQKSQDIMKKYFRKISPTWVSQDGAWSPQFLPLLKEKGVQYILLDQRVLNRFAKGVLNKAQRFQACNIQGRFPQSLESAISSESNHSWDSMPCLFFGFEGLNSYGDYAATYKKRVAELPDDQDCLLYAFIDTERINPPLLDTWLSQIEDAGAKYITPSRFLQQHPPTATSPTLTFDICDWHDWSFHNDVYLDQRLWTQVEKARRKLEESKWWLDQLNLIIPKCEDQEKRISLKSQMSTFRREWEQAFNDIMMAQSSDKSHWYASQHKIDVGVRYAVAGYEKASHLCGSLPLICSQYSNDIPRRQHFMKDTKIALSLLNTTESTYPAGLPIDIDLPYIIVVNLSTKPAYSVTTPELPSQTVPTIFNLIPGLDIQNLRTDLFVPLFKPLAPNEILPIQIEPSDDFEEAEPNENSIENEKLRVEFAEGNIDSILLKDSGFKLGGIKGLPLLSPYFEVHLPKHGVQGWKLHECSADMPNSLIVERESADGILRMTTKYRLFSNFGAVLIDNFAAFRGQVPGIFIPFQMKPHISIDGVLRECLDKPYYSQSPFTQQIFMNDWAILHSGESGGCGMAAIFDPLIHSCKMIHHPEPNFWDFGYFRNFPEWVAQHLLQGVVHQRMWLCPYQSKIDATLLNMVKNIHCLPIVSWYL